MIQIIQVFPEDDYKVYIYFSDGRVKLFDISNIAGRGVFEKLADKEFYFNRCTVLNNTLAWDISGNYDPETCIEVDPYTVYKESVESSDPLSNKV